MATTPLTLATTYQRRVPVSIERVWENVLDWEHLPHKHKDSFADIRCLEEGEWGWRCEVMQARHKAAPYVLETLLERPNRRFVTRMLGGSGAGSEIWVHLTPVAARETAVHIEFNLPIADKQKAKVVGEKYKELYVKLWDEDEDMMVQRDVFLHEPPNPPRTPTRLGGVAAVMASLPKTVTLGGETFRIVDISGQLMAHSTLCPHMQGPLDVEPLQGSEVTCPWHGYRFDLRTGHSCDGRKLQLRPAPIVVIDREKNEVRLEWPATPAS